MRTTDSVRAGGYGGDGGSVLFCRGGGGLECVTLRVRARVREWVRPNVYETPYLRKGLCTSSNNDF